MTKLLKRQLENRFGQLIESQLTSDDCPAIMTPSPLLDADQARNLQGGGTPPALIRIPVAPTPCMIWGSETPRKKSRHMKVRQGVGGVAHV